MSTVSSGAVPAIQLLTSIPEGGVADSVIPLRWCVSRETSQELMERRVFNPHILIVVVNGDREVSRYLVPLTAEMRYVEFHKPGRNTVYATIVWRYDGNVTELKKFFFRRTGGRYYRYDVFSEFDKTIPPEFDGCERIDYTAGLDVVVPEDMFASEPPTWLKNYVEIFFRYRAVDQCDFRRRAAISLAILPFVSVHVALITLLRGIYIAGLLFFGKRRINFTPLIHPFRDDFKDIRRHYYGGLGPSIYTEKANGRPQRPLFWFLNPPVLTVLFVLVWSANRFTLPDSFDSLKVALAALLIALAFAFVTYMVIAVTSIIPSAFKLFFEPLGVLFDRLENGYNGLREAGRRRRQVKETQQAKKQVEMVEVERAQQWLDIETLACNGERAANVEALPERRRTVYLRFQALKAKVCRPYARY